MTEEKKKRNREGLAFNVRDLLDMVYTEHRSARAILPDTHTAAGLVNALLTAPEEDALKLLKLVRGAVG